MSATALIPTTNAAASRIPSFSTARTRRKSSVSVMNSLVTEAAADQAAAESETPPRRLILLRHAKRSWKNRSLKDHDLPLSKSGRADAVKLSKKLDKLGWVPELILSRCMGHNRGWEEAASMLSGTPVELKTCNAALLEATGKSWEEAFSLAGFGGWKLHGIVKPDTQMERSF
ncbi:3-bisphosphoglycerate-dependent phosphoglyceratemutase [Striga asiatica]|uniref:3-bisphosphoglycerate-dependent phosphoglyceratemutase n=1 Tax=Striga asiatica TaxID=4170 RepID=A0A5A7QSA2_STRAF|nr:3-bisphosphoglycerate-dependent phosphoglyceratemutase [Striga asiatica]